MKFERLNSKDIEYVEPTMSDFQGVLVRFVYRVSFFEALCHSRSHRMPKLMDDGLWECCMMIW